MEKSLRLIAIFVLICGALAGAARAEDLCAEPAKTTEGPVRGMTVHQSAACAFLGIPYAAPPVGDLRFKAPAPPAVREGTLTASAFGPACMQVQSVASGGKAKKLSEDCLYLNVWRPAKSGVFPVMFWIHGGGYTIGAGFYDMYDGANLAAQRDVVVVTINYRLGALGFLALPELSAEDPDHGAGNYGLLDTIAALQWTRANIAGFGGDPDNLTIFGESAGGVSVCSLLASPPASGLFQRAIIESGGCDLAIVKDKMYAGSRKLAVSMGCTGDDASGCLRSKPASAFLAMKDSGFSASACVDGYVLPEMPIDAIKHGKFNQVPIMVGSNKDEGNLFVAFAGGTMVPGFVLEKMMRQGLGSRADEIMAMYPKSEYGKPLKALEALVTEGFGSRAFAAAEALAAQTPTYMYRFDWDQEVWGKSLGAFHGLEISLVFGNVIHPATDTPLGTLFSKKAVRTAGPLSERMMSYWTNFAKTGDPNSPGLTPWPLYDTTERKRIILDSIVSAAPISAVQLAHYQYFASLTMEDLSLSALTNKGK
ncbi:MAG TPA: carboxylesterase/lipase family protein [bacterium]|nr:carboxylesterase/lipase family protein [bacterium]